MAKSEAEKRADQARRQREYRARVRAKRNAELEQSMSDAPEMPTKMRDAVESSLAAMSKWITASDGASVQQARALAHTIDRLEWKGDDVRALSAHRALSRVLHDLGGTPTVRMQHELRSLKAERKVEGDGKPLPGNVSKLERPAKRRASR
jgi:hypothetical protein